MKWWILLWPFVFLLYTREYIFTLPTSMEITRKAPALAKEVKRVDCRPLLLYICSRCQRTNSTADICWVHTICQTLFEILHGFGHVILTTTLWGWCYYCFLWINEVPYKTETCPGSHSYYVMEPGLQPRALLSSHYIKCAILNVWGFSLSFLVKDILSKLHTNHKDEQGNPHYIGKTIGLELNMVLKQFIPSLDLKIKK